MAIKLDLIDKKILNQLDLNCRQSDAEIGKKIRVSKQVVNYRIRKLVEEGIITRFFTEINTAKLGYGAYKIYLQFQSLSKEKEEELWNFLVKHPKIPWIVATSGRWDMIIGIFARDVTDFDKILTEIMDKYSRFILNRDMTIFNIASLHHRKWILPRQEVSYSTLGGKVEGEKLDKNDIKILRLLANDAKKPIIDLAKETGLTSGTVIYKIKQLKKKEIIQRFRISLNLKKLNMEFCKAFIYYQNKTAEKEKQLLNYCYNIKSIHGASQSIGSWDLELEFEVKSFEDFYNIMKEMKNKFPLIRSFETVYISKEYGINYIPEDLNKD